MARIQWPVLALTLLTAGSLLAQAPPGAEVPRVTIDFDQVEVREAMAQLAEQTGAEFLVTPEVRGTFSARFRDEPLDKVLRLLALTLGAEVRLVEGVFIVRRPGAAAVAEAAPAAGAGALLPGAVPETPLQEAGAPPLVGTAAEAPPAQRPRPTRETIPLENRSATEVARALGGGSIDAQGRYHPPTEAAPPVQPTTPPADPYRNLPPGARVTRNGTIMMPNGTTILPSGVVIAPNGTVYQPAPRPYLTVPYGTTPEQLQQYYNQQYQNQTPLTGNLGGTGFGVGQGGVLISPPAIKVGGATVTLPPVQIGGQNQNPQTLPPGLQPRIYYGTNAPGVHYGQKPGNWFYGLPPDWSVGASPQVIPRVVEPNR